LTADTAAGVDRAALQHTLDAAAAALSLPLSPGQSGRLLDYLALLTHWNRTYNLTAVRGPAAMLVQHVIDCLAAIPPVRRAGAGGRVLDVGSGGGLPGVIWAIVEPQRSVTCVDSVGKKAAFVQHVATSLGLANLSSRHARVETMQETAFDLVVSRAFASLGDFVAVTDHVLGDAGLWMAMKGKVPLDEIKALPVGVQAFHVEPLRVPGLSAERCLVWLRRTSAGNA